MDGLVLSGWPMGSHLEGVENFGSALLFSFEPLAMSTAPLGVPFLFLRELAGTGPLGLALGRFGGHLMCEGAQGVRH